tara:strand:- start:165 stop:497 length:333 start_codon:yes stop_codon:yes gene_type:complete
VGRDGREWKVHVRLIISPPPETGNGKYGARGRASGGNGKKDADITYRRRYRMYLGSGEETHLVGVEKLPTTEELVDHEELFRILDARVEVEGGVLGEHFLLGDLNGTHFA